MYGGAPGGQQLTRLQAESWYQQLVDTPHSWVIEIDGRAVGDARLHSIREQDSRANLAIGIEDPTLLGRGYGTEAIKLLLGYAFGPMRLNRIGVRVLEYNSRALRAYEKCGFVVEGRERQAARVDDRWYDDIMLGLLAREWRELAGMHAADPAGPGDRAE